MLDVTKQLIKETKVKKLKYDWMGYEFDNINQLSFHHLVFSKQESILLDLKKDGYTLDNGAILTYAKYNSSHDYLHLIQRTDYDRFIYLTERLVEINIQRNILYEELIKIHGCLESFEREYCGSGIIKPAHIERRITLNKNYPLR